MPINKSKLSYLFFKRTLQKRRKRKKISVNNNFKPNISSENTKVVDV